MSSRQELSFSALPLQQNEHRFYLLTIPIDDLVPYCYVARRKEDPIAGFQRNLNENRAVDIANYLVLKRSSISTNIVLSAQEETKLSYSSKLKVLTFEPLAAASFLVLDGQHRLWGYKKCTIRHRVPVAIYENLSRQDEAKLFIDINTTQRGVPAALLSDIKQVAEVESNIDQILRILFDQLNADPLSMIKGRMSPSETARGMISRPTFNRSVAPILTSGMLMDSDDENRYLAIRHFINAFVAELPQDGKDHIVRSAYFEAMFAMFDDVMSQSIARFGNVSEGSLQEVLRPVANIDYSSVRGRWTKASLLFPMEQAFRRTMRITRDML